jgi:hypothetical protein
MAAGRTAEGLECLDTLGWVREAKGDYIRQAAGAYVEGTRQGEALDQCIAIAPTWDENNRLTEAIRGELKQSGRLQSAVEIEVHDPLDWTTQQKAEARNYRPGMVVTLTRRAGRLEYGQSFVIERVQAGRIHFQDQAAPFDPARHADTLQVATTRQIELAGGDPILIRRNAKRHGLVNGEVLTCSAIESDGSIPTRQGKTIPASFRDFCHGYVVTSHKSQGRTHDQVVIAAEQMDAKAAYVACSRGRHQASVFTPDKAHLLQRVEQSGDRLAASDVLNLPAASLRPHIWRQQERQAWRRVVDQALVLRMVSRKPERERELLPPEVRFPYRRQPVTRMEIGL